jgi:hypothetical protein
MDISLPAELGKARERERANAVFALSLSHTSLIRLLLLLRQRKFDFLFTEEMLKMPHLGWRGAVDPPK